MSPKKLFIISDSPEIRAVFAGALDDFSEIEPVYLDTVFSAGKLLEQSFAAPFATRPEVIVVDPSTRDFNEPHIQGEFARWSDDIVFLAVLAADMPEEDIPARLGHITPFDVLNPPLSAVEIYYRLRAALAQAESRNRERFFERAVTDLGAGMLIISANGKILWANPEAARLLGYEADALFGISLAVLAGANEAGTREFKPGKRRSFTTRMTRRDGSRFWANCIAGDLHSPERPGFTLVFTDISEKKAREDELLLSAKVFEFSGEAIMITDMEDRILTVNEAFVRMTGYPAEEVIGRPPVFLNSGRQDHRFYETIWAAVHREGHWTGEVWNRLKNGRIRPMWMAVSAVENSAGDIDHYVTILSDITDRLADEKHLRHMAQHDFLTGLPNRVLLKDRFSQAAADASRNKRKIALLFLDLDRFKSINDRDGHTVGDQLLQQVAERLLGCLRSSDTACRWGGDEFVLLFSGITETESVSRIVGKISASMRQPFKVNGDVYKISASIGVGLFPDHGTNLDALLTYADMAMYSAKKNGDGSSIIHAGKE